MSYPINYPTPQGANVQIFTNSGSPNNVVTRGVSAESWVKPQGASFVWFTLIGPGGSGDPITNLSSGGSGAVTNCLVPAFLIPDELLIYVGAGELRGTISRANSYTAVLYQTPSGGPYELIRANGGNGSNAGAATGSTFFSAAGFYQSIGGQIGGGGATTPSSTTFLGAGGQGGVTANYGYFPSSGSVKADGFFQFQPIIVGAGANYDDSAKAGVGCGGAYGNNFGGDGGPGLAVIISW